MGRLSQQLRNGGGPRPRSNGSDGGPLRKIVGLTFVGPGSVRFEALECGHLQLPKHDLMGETNAVRRRCRKCKLGRVVHFTGEHPAFMTDAEFLRIEEAKPTAT